MALEDKAREMTVGANRDIRFDLARNDNEIGRNL